jgi:serine/threonine protein kinase
LDNILIDKDLNVKVSDFGISTQMNNQTHLTTHYERGKFFYKAPEIFKEKV